MRMPGQKGSDKQFARHGTKSPDIENLSLIELPLFAHLLIYFSVIGNCTDCQFEANVFLAPAHWVVQVKRDSQWRQVYS